MRAYILSIICLVILFVRCAQQDEYTIGSQKVAVSEDAEEAADIFKENKPAASNEILESKHYWKVGQQKVEDMADLINMLSDSMLDPSIKMVVESEVENLIAKPDKDAEHIINLLRNVKSIRRTRIGSDRTELEECEQSLRCFSMIFNIKRVNGEKDKAQINFVLIEETLDFGTESELVRKVKIENVQMNITSD